MGKRLSIIRPTLSLTARRRRAFTVPIDVEDKVVSIRASQEVFERRDVGVGEDPASFQIIQYV